MKTEKKFKILFLIVVFSLFFSSFGYAQVNLTVVYPKEEQVVHATDSTFIFGQVTPPTARLHINGNPVRLYPNGTYLAFLPVETGDFVFNCAAILGNDTAKVERFVIIPELKTTSTSDSVVFDSSYVYPAMDWELRAGDIFEVKVKGTPGCKASFEIDGLTLELPMIETSFATGFSLGNAIFGSGKSTKGDTVKGIYTGTYEIQPFDWVDQKQVRFRLISVEGDTAEMDSPGRLTVLNTSIPQIGELISEKTTARTGPWLGYHLFLPKGVRAHITGRRGPYYRLRLSEQEDVWVQSSDISFLPAGTPLPQCVVHLVNTENRDDKARVRVFTSVRVPYKVEQIVEPATLLVTFYGITADTDWIKYDFRDELIREIRWAQPARGVYQLKIELNQRQQWGYHADYENNEFILDIKKSPEIAGWPSSPLKGITVLLDPGHGPDLGAVGPSGATEKDVNLALANELKAKIEAKGATAFLSREDLQGIALRARPKTAAIIDVDILLSLHHNALPDGINPFKSRGSSTYYYQPQSYELARLLQAKLLDKLELPNFGLFYDNLAVCRPTEMPAVLIEAAFMMHPEEEMLILSEKGRTKTAEAIVEALEDFLKESKE